VNPYSTNADFGAGLSVTYRSLALTPLVHFGRDLRLTQGLQIGQTATFVTTERYWRPVFGIAVSVRVPLLPGGGSSSGSSNGGTGN
jgi:hypothetical protein